MDHSHHHVMLLHSFIVISLFSTLLFDGIANYVLFYLFRFSCKAFSQTFIYFGHPDQQKQRSKQTNQKNHKHRTTLHLGMGYTAARNIYQVKIFKYLVAVSTRFIN